MQAMTTGTRCPKCGAKAVRSRRRPGRTMRYRNIGALQLPADFLIPTCGRCAAEYLSPATCDHLAPLLLSSYQAALRAAGAILVTAATADISQRKLEAVLGVSPGYLSGIKSGKRQPSSAFVALLYLAAQPGAIAGLERFFAFLGCSENLG